MLGFYKLSSFEWKPSPVVALATSADSTRVAAAREDGSLEIWLVSHGAVGWHCQLTIHGDPNSRVSSLVWCCTGAKDTPYGRLFSSGINGCVYEWDLFRLKQKIVLHSIGVSIWQMAAAPLSYQFNKEKEFHKVGNGYLNGDAHESSSDTDSEDESGVSELQDESVAENPRVALACDDGCVRIYDTSDPEELIYNRTLPRVSGRSLSVAWSADANMIFSGSSDGFIRCWDAKRAQEIYRITVGLGGSGSGRELCVWSLLALRNGTIVSADSTGSVQFWDMRHGTLLQTHSYHKGDVNALAVAPNHNRVFSAGSDGQVILYKLSGNAVGCDEAETSKVMNKWVYVGHVRAHTHDVRALTVAVPICKETLQKPEEGEKRKRRKIKLEIHYSYHKWAHAGVPMLISAGDDAKLHAYSVNDFTKFVPHDICPAPQRVPVQLVLDTVFNKNPLLLVQQPYSVDILRVRVRNGTLQDVDPGTSSALATTDLVVRVRSKTTRKIICSTMSSSGVLFAYSDHVKPNLYELKKHEAKGNWAINKRQLPRKLPYAHCMVFSVDSSQLVLAGHDRRIYVIDVGSSEVVNTFSPSCKESDEELPPNEPPITKMFTSSDGQWLAAINCLGDIYVFNLEVQRLHCKISKSHLNNSSITAGGFSPRNNSVLIVTTTSNQVYAFDVEAKQLGEWSKRHSFSLPRRFLEFPGEVFGLCFPPAANQSSVLVYSARAFCLIDFGKPVDQDDEPALTNSPDPTLKKLQEFHLNSKLKRKLQDYTLESRITSRKNFDIHHFREPVLYMGHLSRNSVLIIDKPWLEVVKTFDTAPVHRHIFGT